MHRLSTVKASRTSVGYMCLTIPNHSVIGILNGSLGTGLLWYFPSKNDFEVSPESTSPHNPVEHSLMECTHFIYFLFNPSTARSKMKTNPWHTSVSTGQRYLFPVFSRSALVVLCWNSGMYQLSTLFTPCNAVTSSDTHHSFVMVPKFFSLVLKLNTFLFQGKCTGNTPESPTPSLRKRNVFFKYSRVLLREMKVGFYLSCSLFQVINVTIKEELPKLSQK